MQPCPLCHKDYGWRGHSNVSVSDAPGSARSACKRCAKDRMDDIGKRNWIMGWTNKRWDGKAKDPQCDHKWASPSPYRFACELCGAQMNYTCGHGGSMYVCADHAKGMLEQGMMSKDYLDEHSR